jgi:hypothetical protein
MQKDLREKIKAATEASGITKPGFVELLSLIDQHYDKMEATITQTVRTATQADLTALIASLQHCCLWVRMGLFVSAIKHASSILD